MALGKECRDCHIRLMLDNTTAIAYVNRMGGTHSWEANSVAKEIWAWAIPLNIWLSAAHIPGSQNVIADFKSRNFMDHTEWSLPGEIFQQISNTYFLPSVDLFASRLNCQVSTYVSWHPDPEAWAVDAFSVCWTDFMFYAFPPFSLIGKVLRNIRMQMAEGLLVVPLWTTQPWFPVLLSLLVAHPRVIQSHPGMLILPGTHRQHPLHRTLRLLVVHLSGVPCRTLDYQRTLSDSSPILGGLEHWGSMTPCLEDGEHFVWNGKLIPVLPL